MDVRAVVEEQYQKQQLLLTRQVASSIERSLNEKVLLLEVIARANAGIPADKFQSDLKSVYDMGGMFYVVEYVSENGTIISGYPEENVAMDFNLYQNKQEKAFEWVKTTGEVYITEPLRIMEGNYGSFIWVPVYEGDEFKGAFIAILKETDIKNQYMAGSNSSSYVYMLDSQGKLLYDESTDYKRGTNYSQVMATNTSGFTGIISRQMNGTEGYGKYFVLENGTAVEERLVAYSPISWYNQKWSLAIDSPASQVDRLIVSVYLKLSIVAVISVLFIIFVSSFVVIILFNWSKSLEREVDSKTLELKKSNESLKAANRKLKEVDRLKTEFLSIVSHELKTPLTAMKTSSDFLLENDTCDMPIRHQMLDIIVRNIDRQARMVDDLLDVSRIESNRMKFNRESVSIRETINITLEMIDKALKDKHMKVTVDVPENLPSVNTDKDKLVQVFVNLLNNAVKFSSNYGKITISAVDEGDSVKISIEDYGIGMSSDELDRIFDKFYQIDSTSTRKFGGSGLGLSIVKGIIEGQGGTINAFSKKGRGSMFVFTLNK